MNGFFKPSGDTDSRPDILPHKYRPKSNEELTCHAEQANQLRNWIQQFLGSSKGVNNESSDSDYDDDSSSSQFRQVEIAKNCALLTGPPGVGKTSLVYTVANELNLHVVESHSSEKRDSKLFSMLRLTNQKGKINAFAKLFQMGKPKSEEHSKSVTRRKRRKLTEDVQTNEKNHLSLSDDSSIVLFDDIDVIFEEDGPFLKSLIEFIKESKRPVILTATQSIDFIKTIVLNCEHIHLDKPIVDDCAKILKSVCKREKLYKISKDSVCKAIADDLDCDIRQCLNKIHFYGDRTSKSLNCQKDDYLYTNLESLDLNRPDDASNESIMKCYSLGSLVDLMETNLNLVDRSTLLERWMLGRPSFRNEEYNNDINLGEQIKDSIAELTRASYPDFIMSDKQLVDRRKELLNKRELVYDMGQIVNRRINSRIEPPDKEFYTEILPYVGEMVKIEGIRKANLQINRGCDTGMSRRAKKMLSYLDSISVYMDLNEINFISDTLLNPMGPDVAE